MFKSFFWTTFILLLSAGVLVFTLTQLDPLGSQALLVLSLFFTSLFGTILTVFTYLFFFGSELFAGRNQSLRTFHQSLRRGIWIALFALFVVVLRLFNLLGWIEVILMAVFFLLLELIFFVDDAKIPQK